MAAWKIFLLSSKATDLWLLFLALFLFLIPFSWPEKMGWQNFGTLRVCFGGIHHQWLLEWNSFCRATLPCSFPLVWNFISLLRWFLEFRTRDSSDGSELTVPPVTPVVCLLFPLWSKLIFCLRCQRTDNTLLSTSCRDQRICFCVFITIVRRRFALLFVGAGADAGLLTSWLTGFIFWRRLCTLPGLLALNSMHRPQQTRNSFWDCFRARWLIRVSIVRDLQVFQISPYWHQLWDQWSSYFPPSLFVWDLALRWSLSPGSHHTYRPRRRVMGLPFSHFLLFGTLCLLGTSLRLIGTRLSGKMLLHTCTQNSSSFMRTPHGSRLAANRGRKDCSCHCSDPEYPGLPQYGDSYLTPLKPPLSPPWSPRLSPPYASP